MKKILLITLATTMSIVAAETTHKRLHPDADQHLSSQMAAYDNGSTKQQKALPLPNLEAISYDVTYLNSFNSETVLDTNIRFLDISHVPTLSVEDIALLGELLPKLKVLYINGNKILGSDMPLFVRAFAKNFPTLITLGIGYVPSIPANRVEEYAKQYSWEATISKTPPSL